MSQGRDRNVPPGILDESRRTITNKVTGEVITWLQYGYETKNEVSVATVTCAPGGGPPLHYHTTYQEKFEGVEGEGLVFLGDEQPKKLEPGDTLWIPMGTKHRFTSEKDEIKLKVTVVPCSPGFERSLYILFGLNNDDQTDVNGLPKSLVQTAIVSKMSDMRFPGVGGMFMNALVGVLAMYGRWSGEEERLLRRYWD